MMVMVMMTSEVVGVRRIAGVELGTICNVSYTQGCTENALTGK